MPRVYHNGAAGIALPLAGPAAAARAVLSRPLDPFYVDPVATGMQVKITIMLTREEL
jgi:hypothetical protein